jgi:hypothetical protein
MYADNRRCDLTQNPEKEQLAALRRLRHFRREVDAWRGGGSSGQPPQPGFYGLRLGSLSSSEIYWASP